MTEAQDNLEELQAAFFRVYANVPLNIRQQIVVVIDGKPISWDVAFIEVNSMTEKSESILHTLRNLAII